MTRIMLTLCRHCGQRSADVRACDDDDLRERERCRTRKAEDRANAEPQERSRGGRELARVDVERAGAGEEVESREKDETERPEAHAEVVHVGVIEAPEKEGHAAQLKEDGDASRERERIPDLRSLSTREETHASGGENRWRDGRHTLKASPPCGTDV